MSESFEGSVVLTQDSVGHCTISGPSLCTQKHIREYLVSGTLPKPGTVCEAIGTPFSPPTGIPYEDYSGQKVFDSKVSGKSDFEGTDKEILDAVIEFSQVYF
ncbi:hypothetical protein CPC08DRAFT_768457 [Agrocybe pediades]|nr:hypothetical protein CPC08DRAFT_768457 [Agrocybe pediades]